jgi:hypothetical protein
VLGPGSLPRLIEEFDAHVDVMRDHAHRLFERWLDAFVAGERAL